MEKSSLATRMKRYEESSRYILTPRTPVIIRCDGKAFHTFTRKMDKPFDSYFIGAMTLAANEVAKRIQGFKMAYVQSDEASFLFTDYDKLDTQGWFNYRVDKMVSISASLMSVWFNYHLNKEKFHTNELPIFDSRVFNIPENDIANYFLWRYKDWNRNSIQMYAQSFFSHKQLHKKSCSAIHEMLHAIGKNWAKDLSNIEKNGTFFIKKNGEIILTQNFDLNYNSIDSILKELLYDPNKHYKEDNYVV